MNLRNLDRLRYSCRAIFRNRIGIFYQVKFLKNHFSKALYHRNLVKHPRVSHHTKKFHTTFFNRVTNFKGAIQ